MPINFLSEIGFGHTQIYTSNQIYIFLQRLTFHLEHFFQVSRGTLVSHKFHNFDKGHQVCWFHYSDYAPWNSHISRNMFVFGHMAAYQTTLCGTSCTLYNTYLLIYLRFERLLGLCRIQFCWEGLASASQRAALD